jgi:hypothetical protein
MKVTITELSKKGHQLEINKIAIQYKKTADLVPYARNSRTHSKEQIDQIVKSINEFGWTNPILISEKNDIIAGHGRVLAAEKLGMKEVPCIQINNLTEIQRRAYVMADNKLALNAGWDDELLKLELHALDEADYDLSIIGFDASELSTIMFDDLISEDDKDDEETNFIVQYNIIFDDQAQQDVWFDFIKTLKTQYADAETIGERLVAFIKDTGYGES